jgi:hypothetical protein
VSTNQLNCKNCARELAAQDDYCSNCGGKVIRNRLTLRNLFHHISETYFNYDNKLLRTFFSLFNQPEDVINGYINGVRKKYVDVVSYFALAITLSGLQIFIMGKLGMDMNMYDTSTELGRKQQAMFEQIYTYTTEYQSLVMMLYIPLYALIALPIFRKYKRFNYTELLVVFMYGQAHFSICSALFILPLSMLGSASFALLGTLILPLQIVFFAFVLKRVYGLTVKQILWRTFIFLIVLFVLFVIASILVAVVMYQSGMLDKAGE